MKDGFVEKFVKQGFSWTAIICLAMILCLVFFKCMIPAVIGLCLLIADFVYEGQKTKKKKVEFSNYIENLAEEMDVIVKKNIINNPLPICIIKKTGQIEWHNHIFGSLFKKENVIYTDIHQIIPSMKMERLVNRKSDDAPLLVTINEKIYKIITGNNNEDDDSDNMLVLYFNDVTTFENLKKMHKDEKSCALHIFVDNYEELMLRASEENKTLFSSQVEMKIKQFAQKNMAPLIKYDDDRYYMVMDNKHLENNVENKFAILDEVRGIETGADFPVSLSIGVGAGGKDYLQSHEFAAAAIDLAMGRGGDQVVVKRNNQIDYYGGRLQTVEKRNKGKSRIMSHALKRLIEQSSGVLVMGHKNADMDAFGAAVGIHSFAKKFDRPVAIVMDRVGESLANMYNYVKDTGDFNIISTEAALASVGKDTLLIVVDTHNPSYTECPELLEKVEKKVVIDHHRKMEMNISNPVLSYMESYASSTCELVAEIIQYIGAKNVIGKVEADALLAGITLDTKHFASQTGVRTFEAASYLRRVGADSSKVRSFFQVDPDLYKVKAKAILEAELIKMDSDNSNNIAVTRCEGRDENVGLITAQTADELLEIKGVRAAVVLGENPAGVVMVSARSIGDINVQVLMEKLGGGGHLNTAGAQLTMPIEGAEAAVKEIIYGAIKERSEKKNESNRT